MRKRTVNDDRAVALVLAACTAVYFIGIDQLQSLRSDDPLGPAGFPFYIGAATMLLSIVLFILPTQNPQWVSLKSVAWIYLAAFASYTLIFPLVGFSVSTFLILLATAYMLGAGKVATFLFSALTTASLFLVFSILLDARLPTAF